MIRLLAAAAEFCFVLLRGGLSGVVWLGNCEDCIGIFFRKFSV